MRNLIISTPQGFLETCRTDPRTVNHFVRQQSAAVKLSAADAMYFADRYDGTVIEVSCEDCGTIGMHVSCSDGTGRAEDCAS